MLTVIMGIVLMYSIFISPPNAINVLRDKFPFLSHFVVYFVVSLVAYETILFVSWGLGPGTRCLITILSVFLYSLSIECLQLFTPLRVFELVDILAGILGISFGAVFMVILRDHKSFAYIRKS